MSIPLEPEKLEDVLYLGGQQFSLRLWKNPLNYRTYAEAAYSINRVNFKTHIYRSCSADASIENMKQDMASHILTNMELYSED